MPDDAAKRNGPGFPLPGCVLVTATTFGMQDPGLRSELERSVAEVRYSPEKRPLTAAELTGPLDGTLARGQPLSQRGFEQIRIDSFRGPDARVTTAP